MREKPNFDKKAPAESQSKNDDWGFVQMLLICVVGYISLSSFGRVISGHGESIDGIICPATLVCLAIAVILSEQNKKKEKQRLHEAQQEWKQISKSDEVTIVNRSCNRGGVYEDGYYPGEFHTIHSYYRLELAANADQRAVIPNQTKVDVEVSQGVYDCLENRDTVRIYYKPEAPFTFLLEEEL
jgi:hypothetical protein